MIIFAVYSNIELVIRNYNISQKVDQTKDEVSKLQLRNERLQLLLSYYQSASYQDVEARARLGLQKPDEKAVIIKGINAHGEDETLNQDIYSDQAVSDKPAQQTNLQRWWQYFWQ